jgi:hypothetical protein
MMRRRSEVAARDLPLPPHAGKVTRHHLQSTRRLLVLRTLDDTAQLKGGEIVWVDADEPEPIVEVARGYASAIRVLPRTKAATVPGQEVGRAAELPALTVAEAIRELVTASTVTDKQRLQAAIDEVLS